MVGSVNLREAGLTTGCLIAQTEGKITPTVVMGTFCMREAHRVKRKILQGTRTVYKQQSLANYLINWSESCVN